MPQIMEFTCGEVQQFLTEHYQKHHYKIGYLDALTLMNIYQTPHEGVERPNFLSWNCEDEDELVALSQKIPVWGGLERHNEMRRKLDRVYKERHQIEHIFPVSILKEAHNVNHGLHYESGYKLIFVLRGRCKIRFKDTIVELKEQEGCIFAPNTLHIQDIGEEDVAVAVCMMVPTVQEKLPILTSKDCSIAEFLRKTMYGQRTGYMVFGIEKDREIYENLKMMFHGEVHAKIEKLILQVNLLLLNLQERILWENTVYEGAASKRDQDVMPEILACIRENCATITLDGLAHMFSYDKTYLSKRIKTYSGCTCSELIRKYRIERAKPLVRFSEYRLEEIGQLVGYPSRNNFCKAFRLETGCSPQQYRTEGEKAAIL